MKSWNCISRNSVQSSNQLLNIYPSQRNENLYFHRNLYIHIYNSIIFNSFKLETTWISFSRWIIKQMWPIRTIKDNWAIKRNALLIHTVTWMNLQGINAEWKGQSPKVMYYMIPLIQYSWNDKIVEMENHFRIAIARSQDRGVGRLCLPFRTEEWWWL